ncbi:MAG: aminodeoxychorismate synthase component I [Aurantibacter sp.]
MSITAFKEKVSQLIESKVPFVFIIDFEMKNPLAYTLEEFEERGFLFDIKGKTNSTKKTKRPSDVLLNVKPIAKEKYLMAFSEVQRNINKGNSFLLNLTFPSEIKTDASLEEIFHLSRAPYKLFRRNKFVVYSPECFVKIEDDYIYSYPMKGTIDVSVPNAEYELMNSEKETREHNTIVDLIRNDLSMVASEVSVTKFRYVEKIKSHQNEILQTSSEIRGKLQEGWEENFCDILFKLLPAGSISGAPKQKTLEIINGVEIKDRGFYTGVFGIFDGKNVDSGVSIRFIEKENNKFWYRSGGGITALSNAEEEYQELIDKIHVPTI